MIKRHSPLWWVVLICGLLCSAVLLGQRALAEWNDRAACAAMSLEDIALLAEESGLPAETWQETLKESGVRYFIGEESAFVLPEDTVPDTSLPLALVENHDRTSVLLPEGFDLESYEGPLVKTLYLYEDYANRAFLTDAQEIENLLFRGVTDRGLRLLILTPFYTPESELVLDPAVYTDCLEGLEARLESRGITFGDGFSCMETSPLSPLLLLGAGLLPAALGVLLVCRLPKVRRWELPFTIAAVLCVAGLCVAVPALAQKILMLASAILFPCLAACAIVDCTQTEPSLLKERPLVLSAVLGMILLLGWSLLGGFSVSALMASRLYLMEYAIFSGVKLALLTPMVFVCGLLIWVLRRDLLGTGRKSWLSLAFVLVILGGVYLLLTTRSGDLTGSISSIETSLRNWLEYTLYARPRTKELLFAAPCVPLFLWACRRKFAPLQLLCGAGACLECVSVVNTFCHAIAPLHVSVIRSLLGAGLGLVLGLLAVGILNLLLKNRTP